jgi:hypothetical protein
MTDLASSTTSMKLGAGFKSWYLISTSSCFPDRARVTRPSQNFVSETPEKNFSSFTIIGIRQRDHKFFHNM